MAYKFKASVPEQLVYERKEIGEKVIFEPVTKRGIFPFGKQNALITDEELTPGMVEYLKGKEEFADLIEEVKDKK